LPTLGKSSRALIHPLGVVTELLVEARSFSDRPIDQLGQLGPIQWIQAGFRRD
jgi:hypothetical protein